MADKKRKALPRTGEQAYKDGYRNGLEGQPVERCPFNPLNAKYSAWMLGYRQGNLVFQDIAEDQMRGKPDCCELDIALLVIVFIGCGWLIHKIFS